MSTLPSQATESRSGVGDADESATTRPKEVARDAGDQAKRLASEAQDQARQVSADIKDHARDVMDQTRTELRKQAEQGSQRVAGGLNTVADQLRAMQEGRPEAAGPLSGYAAQARQKVEALASRIEDGGVDGVASDITAFARRRPGLFLLSCAGAGFAVARMVRASQAAPNHQSSTSFAAPTGVTRPPMSPPLGADIGAVGLPAPGAP
jgi:hypothetical protein